MRCRSPFVSVPSVHSVSTRCGLRAGTAARAGQNGVENGRNGRNGMERSWKWTGSVRRAGLDSCLVANAANNSRYFAYLRMTGVAQDDRGEQQRVVPFNSVPSVQSVSSRCCVIAHGIRCGLDSLEIRAIRVQTDLHVVEALGTVGGRQRKLRSRCESLKRLLSSVRLQSTSAFRGGG